MRQAIVTKFFGPTNTRGARVKATAQAGSIYVSWDYALGVDENHRAAAEALAKKWEWAGRWTGGALPSGVGYAFVVDCADGFEVNAPWLHDGRL